MRDGTQYVTLGLNRDVFAVPVQTVQEILEMREITRLPNAPDHFLGIIDVRGRSVPVIDLRAKIGLPPAAATASTRILVLVVELGGQELVLGLVADRVFEVTELDRNVLEAPPEIGAQWRSDCIAGIGRHRDRFVIVFDICRVFTSKDAIFLGPSAASLAA